MKAWIYLCAVIFAAGMVTTPAEETKTNTPAGATTNTPVRLNPGAVAPAPARAVAGEAKPAAATLTPTNPIVPPSMTATSAPANAVAGEATPPAQPEVSAPLTPTNTTTAPSTGSDIAGKSALIAGLVILALGGGLAFFLVRRAHKADNASLITRSMKDEKKFPPPMT